MMRNRTVAGVASLCGMTAGWLVGSAVARSRATQTALPPSPPCGYACVQDLVEKDETNQAVLTMACEGLLNMIRTVETAKGLVVSMALGIERTRLPDDERRLLDWILGSDT